jgi:predicted nucleic acid-binding Zn ribbon protein
MKHIPINKILDSLMRDKKYQKGLRLALIEERWVEIVGEQIAKYAHVQGLERGRLMIQCDHDVWRATLHHTKPELLGRIEQVVGKGVVKEIFLN